MESYKREFIEFLEKAGVLKFGDFTAKSGRKIPYFINAGEIKTGAEIATLGEFYARAYREKLGDKKAVLYGPAYKGISIAVSAAVALSKQGLDVPFFFNRKEAKDHGEGGVFVGYLPQAGEEVVITEDVITAGTAIRESMGKVSGFFGKTALRDVPEEDFFANIAAVRAAAGDRAVLRAIHVYQENRRVERLCDALEKGDFAGFLR